MVPSATALLAEQPGMSSTLHQSLLHIFFFKDIKLTKNDFFLIKTHCAIIIWVIAVSRVETIS